MGVAGISLFFRVETAAGEESGGGGKGRVCATHVDQAHPPVSDLTAGIWAAAITMRN